MKDTDRGLFSNNFLLWLILLSLPGSAALFSAMGTFVLWVVLIAIGLFLLFYVLFKVNSAAEAVFGEKSSINNFIAKSQLETPLNSAEPEVIQDTRDIDLGLIGGPFKFSYQYRLSGSKFEWKIISVTGESEKSPIELVKDGVLTDRFNHLLAENETVFGSFSGEFARAKLSNVIREFEKIKAGLNWHPMPDRLVRKLIAV